MVHAYPWLPDIMAVAAVVAAEEGDPEALGHLRADSSGGPGAFVQSCGPRPGSGVRRRLTLNSLADASCIMLGCRASYMLQIPVHSWLAALREVQRARIRLLAQPLPCRGFLGFPFADFKDSGVPVLNAIPCAAAEPKFEGVAMKPARSAEKRLLVATPFAAQSPPAERAPVITSGVL